MTPSAGPSAGPESKPWGVMSGTGAGWGRYATRAEAEETADYVRKSHADVVVVRVMP